MRSHRWISARVPKALGAALVLAFASALIAAIDVARSSPVVAQAEAKVEATIFSYSGQDFVRVQTTLTTESGQSAVKTKLDRSSAAYKALIQKQSWSGDATVFGRKYKANYAPLTGEDGSLTGALFVAVPK